jgi:hypothetical protein
VGIVEHGEGQIRGDDVVDELNSGAAQRARRRVDPGEELWTALGAERNSYR